MSENVDNLILEHLKRFQAGQERIERKLEEVIARIGQLEIGVASLRRDVAHADENAAGMSVRMDRMSERIEPIERRLELS
jgi:phage shock protein A